MTTKTNVLTKPQQTKLASFDTKSDRIRYLSSIGWKKGPIHKEVGVCYQFVWNVLDRPIKHPGKFA